MNSEPNTWHCIELPKSDYREIWKLQTDLVDARKAGAFDRDIIFLLEHSPVRYRAPRPATKTVNGIALAQ